MTVEFRVVGREDGPMLAEVFEDIDETFFRPHPFSAREARRLARYAGRDTYAVLVEDGRAVAYGMLRGRDEGYTVPSLGIAVRTSEQGRGLGRVMMEHLHDEARRQGAAVVRLRVDPRNVRARRLYESLGYAYAGDDRGELVMVVDVERSAIATASATGDAPCALTATLLSPEAGEWAAMLSAVPHDFYHLPAYVELCARQEGGRVVALYVTDGRRAMLLPLVLRPATDGHCDAASPYGYPGPLVAGTSDPAFARIAIVAGRQAMRAAGVVAVFVRFHPLLDPTPPEGIGTLVRHGETVSIDLTLPLDRLWAQIRLNHRRDILRATRFGWVARVDEWRQLGAFMRLYRATMARRSASAFYFFNDAYFLGLRDALGDSLHLITVERDGHVAGAGLFVETDGIVQYHLSGTDDRVGNIQPTKVMIHSAAVWARERGNHVLHLGGGVGGGEDSLMYFKSGFSPRRHSFSTLRMIVDAEAYTRLVLARDPSLDPAAQEGYFPLYRR